MSLPGMENYGQGEPELDRDKPWNHWLVLLANKEVRIESILNDYYGLGVPMDAERWKTTCPYASEHTDGGVDRQFRVYSSENYAYCVDTETEILTRRGWMSWEEVRVGDETLALNAETGLTQWEPVREVIKLPAQRRRMLSMESRAVSSLTTEDHRWLVEHHAQQLSGPAKRSWRWTTSGGGFSHHMRIPLPGPVSSLPQEPKYQDALVELVAWFWTEGTIRRRKSGAPCGVAIYQSPQANPVYVQRIETALTLLFGPPTPSRSSGRPKGSSTQPGWHRRSRPDEFSLNAAAGRVLLEVAPEKIVRPEFLVELTQSQLELFINTSLDGDGARVGRWRQLCQKDLRGLDSLQFAATLAGQPTHVWKRRPQETTFGMSDDWACQFLNRNRVRVRRKPSDKGSDPLEWVDHEGPVWCVRTISGTWTARRRGTVYVTGNCFDSHGHLDPVRLWRMRTFAPTMLDAAKSLLKAYEIDVRPKTAAQRVHALQEASEAPHSDPKVVAQALQVFLSTLPTYEDRQYDDDVLRSVNSVLEMIPSVCGRAESQEEVATWFRNAKAGLADLISR